MTKKLLKHTTPLCFLPNGNLIAYSKGSVIIIDKDDRIVKKIRIKRGWAELLFSNFKPISRLLRIGLRASIAISDNVILFSRGNSLYELDLIDGIVSSGFYLGRGIRPLNFTKIEGIKGFEDGVVFGGYLMNFEKEPVSIYKRYSRDKWKIVFTFEDGAINHIHNIIPDRFRNCIWVLTGDFGEASAIWKISNDFSKVEKVLSNKQMYRSCACFPIKEGLLYATDAPFANNFIYLLDNSLNVSPISELLGSCIYACQVDNQFVFSTTVEPDGRDNTIINLLSRKKRGAGIKDSYAHIYVGNLDKGFIEVYKEKKDLWPYLFQFGAFRFPCGDNKTRILYFQPIATNMHDLDLLSMRL